MDKKNISVLFLALVIMLGLIAAVAKPQLTTDEQDMLIESIIQTLNPEGMKEEIKADISKEMAAKMRAAGYPGMAAAFEYDLPEEAAEATPAPTSASIWPTHTVPASIDGYDNPADYWEGAILQEDGTYRGLHAKFFNSYGYALGEDENGITKNFRTSFIPNERFNVDVVFENDGSTLWPKRIEMRHSSNSGEYTGHTESSIVDRTNNPVKPGDKCGFTVSAHGSENVGPITFFFKLYDADSGSAIDGGEGSFFYQAIP